LVVSLFINDIKLVPNIYDNIVTQIHIQKYIIECFNLLEYEPPLDPLLDDVDDDDDDYDDKERNGDNHNKSSIDVVIFNINDDIIACNAILKTGTSAGVSMPVIIDRSY
jgi:hypothetical protein